MDKKNNEIFEQKVDELVAQNKKFLHELSNKILVASGMSSYVLKEAQSSDGDQKLIYYRDKFEKIVKAMEDAIDLIKIQKKTILNFSNVSEKKIVPPNIELDEDHNL